MELPIACTLTTEELQERRREILEPMRASYKTMEAIPSGYAYTFPGSSETLVKLAQLVDLESQCCKFLTFQIVLGAGDDTIRLEVTGSADAKEAIADFFGG